MEYDILKITYLAGFFDGEGTISVLPHSMNKNSIIVMVSACQVDPRPIMLLKELFGGSVMHVHNGENCKMIWKWSVCHKAAETFLKVITPYLIVKKEKAEIALKIRSTITKSGGNRENRKVPENIKNFRISLLNDFKKVGA
jgi:hypothetical protein